MQHVSKLSRLAILAAALSASACTATPYLGVGVTAEDVRYFEFNRVTGQTVATPRNPLGRAVVGVELQPAPAWRISLDLSHTSSLRTGDDRGVNAASLAVRWFPFN